jgi:DoxX-like family
MRRTTLYWVVTVGLAWELGFGGASDLLRLDYVRTTVEHLGYPLYLLTILGVWKVLATVALVIPGFLLLKEWAYAGLSLCSRVRPPRILPVVTRWSSGSDRPLAPGPQSHRGRSVRHLAASKGLLDNAQPPIST